MAISAKCFMGISHIGSNIEIDQFLPLNETYTRGLYYKLIKVSSLWNGVSWFHVFHSHYYQLYHFAPVSFQSDFFVCHFKYALINC